MLPEYLIKVHDVKDTGDEKHTLLGKILPRLAELWFSMLRIHPATLSTSILLSPKSWCSMINPGSEMDLKLNLCYHLLTEHHQQQRSHQLHQHQLINASLQFLMSPRDLQTSKLSPNTYFGDKKSIPQMQKYQDKIVQGDRKSVV